MIEAYQLPQGQMIIGHADEATSVGLLRLEAGQALAKHNRPVKEELYQLEGRCVVELFQEDNQVEPVVMNPGDRLEIPAGQFHIHANPYDVPGAAFWKFEGDIIPIIEQIRQSFGS